MNRMISLSALALFPLLLGACQLFAGGSGEMCRMRMEEKRNCNNLFLITYDQCDGDAICEQNAMALNIGCTTIPTDACGKRGGSGGGSGGGPGGGPGN